MSDVLTSLFICSLLMGVFALSYRMFLKKFGKRYQAIWRYRIWYVIIIGFLFFLKPRTIVPEMITANPVVGTTIHNNVVSTSSQSHIMIQWDKIAPFLFWIWIGILIVQAIYFGMEYRQFCRMVKRFQKKTVPLLYSSILEEEKRNLHLEKKKILIAIVSCIDAPMLKGYRKSCILIPNMNLSEESLRFIIRHELIHYKRHDIWCKLLVLIVRCIHWFNPVVYYISDWIDSDCESACDEAVLIGESASARILYGETLLKMIRNQTTCRNRLATAFQEKKSTIQGRFLEILTQGKRKSLLFYSVLSIIIVSLTGTYTASGKEQEHDLVESTTWQTEAPEISHEAEYEDTTYSYQEITESSYEAENWVGTTAVEEYWEGEIEESS